MKEVKRHHKKSHPDETTISAASRPVFDPHTHEQNMTDLEECLTQQSERALRSTEPSPSGNAQTDTDTDLFDDFPSGDDTSPSHTSTARSIYDVDPWNDLPSTRDGDEVNTSDYFDLFYKTRPALIEPQTTANRFAKHMLSGEALAAASILVAQAAFQTSSPVPALLPLPNVMLFLYLAKLVLSTGRLELINLAKVLSIFAPYALQSEKEWAPVPCTVSGFRSMILNVSNSNSLVSILPIPIPETLPDGHGYTPFRSILEHALMMNTFDPADVNDPKWKSLVSSQKFQRFLASIPDVQPPGAVPIKQLAVGIIIWTDGWDTSTGTKSNRSPMHSGTITLLFVEVESQTVVGCVTYPNMGGFGKNDHEPVFQRLHEDILAFERDATHRVLPSRHYECPVECHTHILFIVQDQPERRKASCLLQGNANFHAMFGLSCDFTCLSQPFNACTSCQRQVIEYLAHQDWTEPPCAAPCQICMGWSVSNLTSTSYTKASPTPKNLVEEVPGYTLFHGPGRLTSSLLLAGWQYCIDRFAIHHMWAEADVKKYLHRLCINDETIKVFIAQCRNYVTIKDMADHPEKYPHIEIVAEQEKFLANPDDYALPSPPAMWLMGDMETKTEGVMHLSMGIQKTVFKFIIRWAVQYRIGAALQRRLSTLLQAVQELRVSYCPCRPYKDDKFGGYTAETYRAMSMISCFIYHCLLEADLEPPPPRDVNPEPHHKWTKQDNTNWMYLRDVHFSKKITAPEASAQVADLLEKDPPLPIVNDPLVPIGTDEIRDLVWRMFNMFRAIFCTDLCGIEAKNRATASVMRFLSHMETLDLKLHPKRAQPIWIAKFNFMGLLRVCDSFLHFNHVRNLYEGGVIGEGVVKELRPLVAKGVHHKWATNLLLAYYRHRTLDWLIDETEDADNRPEACPLGDEVASSKFKRYTTTAEVNFQIVNGRPLPVLLYGSTTEWMVGAIIVTQNHWYFKEVLFSNDGDAVDDTYGLAYHHLQLSNDEVCLGKVGEEMRKTMGDHHLPFWDYGILFPDLLNPTDTYRFGIVRSNWQYLDHSFRWSEHQ
jgi:hypothetical protein